jgi:polar amino acid transport system substrate-binding protein
MKRLIITLLLLAFAIAPARADLKDILDKGTIRIGTQMDNPPFGYVGPDGKPAGFDVELGQMIGKALGVKVQLEQIVGANRIPYLLTNKIDLVISAMGATPERAVQVMFTTPYAALYIGVYGPKATAVRRTLPSRNWHPRRTLSGSRTTPRRTPPTSPARPICGRR